MILATHPDVDTNQLEKILEQIKHNEFWGDTIVNVSNRYLKVREFGSISACPTENEDIIFTSKHVLADLRIQEYYLNKTIFFDLDFPIPNAKRTVSKESIIALRTLLPISQMEVK